MPTIKYIVKILKIFLLYEKIILKKITLKKLVQIK